MLWCIRYWGRHAFRPCCDSRDRQRFKAPRILQQSISKANWHYYQLGARALVSDFHPLGMTTLSCSGKSSYIDLCLLSVSAFLRIRGRVEAFPGYGKASPENAMCSASCFEKKPGATFGFVDPDFDKAGGGVVIGLVSHFM